MRVAVVHHWFVTRGGGERVAECIASLFPSAELFTLVASDAGTPPPLRGRPIHTSFLQRVPFGKTHHRHMMPFYRDAVDSLDLRGFDLVISSDSGPVKGVRLDAGAVHICYCHSPMRYLYDGYDAYRLQMPWLTRVLFEASARSLRRYDLAAATRVSHFIANSNYVANRIKRCYGRDSEVIYPPIDVDRAHVAKPGKHYLCAGRLVPYKHTALLLQACRALGRELRIVGAGPDEGKLRNERYATMLGELPTEALWNEYASCRALLFAADEDFGMVPLEAQACGRPVIAFGAGGSLETVRVAGRHPTGVYFPEQTQAAVEQAIIDFESQDAEGRFQPGAIQAWANQFRTELFFARMRHFIVSIVPSAVAVMAPAHDTIAVQGQLQVE